MSKKSNSPLNTEKTSNHYKLNTKAVDRLVNASKMDASSASKLPDPAKEYRSGILDRIPDFVKAIFVKFWFYGAVCYFILWGMGIYVPNDLDMMILMSVVLGLITDILVNNALRFIETLPNANNKWMMFPQKKFWTIFANIIYAFVIYNCVGWFYHVLNVLAISITGKEQIVFSVEPILFGVFYVLFDLLLICMKNLMKMIISDAKNKTN